MRISIATIITTSALILVYFVGFSSQPAFAQRSYCDSYARDYARRYARGGVLEGAAEGALSGALFGGILGGSRGAGSGAAFGAAMGAIGGGAEQARDEKYLYDRAYRDCRRNEYQTDEYRHRRSRPVDEYLYYRYERY